MLIVCLVAACGGNKGKSDSVTWKDACEEIAGTMCHRLEACGESVGSDCKPTLVSACCSGSECDAEAGSESELEQCLDALDHQSCGDLLDGNLPSACE